MNIKSKIELNVSLDNNKIPDSITWTTSDNKKELQTNSFLLALWDSESKSALKIDP